MVLITVCWFVFSNLTEPSYVYKFSWIAYEDDHKISISFYPIWFSGKHFIVLLQLQVKICKLNKNILNTIHVNTDLKL